MSFSLGKIVATSAVSAEQLTKYVNSVNNLLKAAESRNPPSHMVVQIYFWDGTDRIKSTPLAGSLDLYSQRIASVLDQLNLNSPSLLGVALGEENIPGNGRNEILQGLYDFIKAKYPGVNVYQWWSGNLLSPEWRENKFLSADGWVIDPYTLGIETAPDEKLHWGRDPYRRLVEKYVITRKPVISVLWASDERPFYFDRNDARNKQGFAIREIMDHQLDIDMAYNIPTAFYQEHLNDAGRLTPYFTRDDGKGSSLLQSITDFIDHTAQRASNLPANYSGDPNIAETWEGSAINIQDFGEGYKSDFRNTNFLNLTDGTGFRDLYWNGQALGFVGFNGRPVAASITYRLSGSGLRNPEVDLDFTNNQGTVTVKVGNSQGGLVTQSFNQQGFQTASVKTAGTPGFGQSSNVVVEVDFNGPPGSFDTPTVVLNRITIKRG
jgi:hypothetical protein